MIKVIWGTDWDQLIEKDRDGLLVKRMGELCDGQYQKLFVESGAYFRQNFFGTDPRLLKMAEHLSDEQIGKMRLGGHDPIKVYAAYKAAVEHTGSPTVILAKTIKGYGLGESGEGRNITHQQKKINDEELMIFRSRFGIPIEDENCTMRRSTVRPTKARRSSTCASGASNWAGICRIAKCARPSWSR